MSVKVIGAGVSRTGTISLKTALEYLGYGKCYHCFEILSNIHHLDYWYELHKTGSTDFARLFEGYQSTLDFPAITCYQQLMELYPDAKVILTIRDADSWYESAIATIFKDFPFWMLRIFSIFGLFSKKARGMIRTTRYADEVMVESFYKGSVHDPEACKAVFNAWNEQVIKTVPPERLLIYRIQEGWDPLCRFLGVEKPAIPFPYVNKRQEFFVHINKLFPHVVIDSSKIMTRTRGEKPRK